MLMSKRELLRIIREEAAKSTKKYDDDSALKGDQDELPDELQKGIIDKTVEDREKNESKYYFTRRQLIHVLREEMTAAAQEPVELDSQGLADVIGSIVQDLATQEEPRTMGDGGHARMAKQQLQQIASAAQSLHDRLNDDDEIPEWTQSNIAVAEDNIDAIAGHLDYKMDNQE